MTDPFDEISKMAQEGAFADEPASLPDDVVDALERAARDAKMVRECNAALGKRIAELEAALTSPLPDEVTELALEVRRIIPLCRIATWEIAAEKLELAAAALERMVRENERLLNESCVVDIDSTDYPVHEAVAILVDDLRAEVERLSRVETADKIIARLREEVADLRAENKGLCKLRETMRKNHMEEIGKLKAAAVPLCIGQPLIGILAKEGAWQSSAGQCIVAADDLHGADPYAECDRLRAENAEQVVAQESSNKTILRLADENAELRRAVNLFTGHAPDHEVRPFLDAVRGILTKTGSP